MEPAGRDPGTAFGAPAVVTSDALFPEEVQSFPDNFPPAWGMGPWNNFGLRHKAAIGVADNDGGNYASVYDN